MLSYCCRRYHRTAVSTVAAFWFWWTVRVLVVARHYASLVFAHLNTCIFDCLCHVFFFKCGFLFPFILQLWCCYLFNFCRFRICISASVNSFPFLWVQMVSRARKMCVHGWLRSRNRINFQNRTNERTSAHELPPFYAQCFPSLSICIFLPCFFV